MITYIGISGRNDIPRFLNEEGLTGEGVEIGTHRGVYAEFILNNWRGRRLNCVDPWEESPAYADQVQHLTGGPDQIDAKREAHNRLFHNPRCRILPYTSANSVQFFDDNSLDFVYIDGNHKLDFIMEDLTLWYPKVKPGGYVFGHDIVCPGETSDNPNGGWGAEIQPAVMTFTMLNLLDFSIIPDGTEPWSFAIRKPV